MKNILFSSALVHCFVLLIASTNVKIINSFVVSSGPTFHLMRAASTHSYIKEESPSATSYATRETAALFSSSPTRPLYDGTNYTFPDTQTPAGVAELLEVSFVHACMQLASGYVDVLKMFIAVSIGAYEAGFSIASVIEELEYNKEMPNTANRPLMDEEKLLRRDWLSVVYLTLAAIEYTHPMASSALAMDTAKKSIPDDIQQRYGELVSKVGEAFKNGSHKTLSVEDLISGGGGNKDLSELQKAILLQSLKVATLTPVVVEESKENRGAIGNKQEKEVKPPTPPIEGAF